MRVDTHTQAVLLLTAHLQKASRSDVKPLTPSEWGRFAGWLHAEGKRPEELLELGEPTSVLHGWHDHTVTRARILSLLGRSAALGVVLERWERAGLWVVARSHPDYPSKLKRRLGHDSPPVLIGCGNVRILKSPAIAVVGSREASEDDLRFTWDLGRGVAESDHVIVSGGARGVDETAMLGCIEAGGSAVGILADSLLRAVTSTKYRDALATDRVVLMTPFNPEAGFNVGNAMARNKYVYCCADAGVIVASGKSKGGTWTGAVEALRAKWIPVWVRTTPSSPDGNAGLVREGALDLGDRLPCPRDLIDVKPRRREEPAELLFDNGAADQRQTEQPSPREPAPFMQHIAAQMSFVDLFVTKLASMPGSAGTTAAEIAETMDVTKAQAQAWLKEATKQGLVVKSARPVRYLVADDALSRIAVREARNGKGPPS